MNRHTPRRRFGQNFLRDPRICERIVAAFDPRPDQYIVEIGPGHGALTRLLAPRAARLDVIEIDYDLADALQHGLHPAPRVHRADALKFDFQALAQDCATRPRVIGNLPYNISTPLLFHLFGQAGVFGDMMFMLQREVVARMAAASGSRTYGRLSVMTQFHCSVRPMFDVPASAFEPPPKVTSTVVHLTPHETAPPVSAQALAEVTRVAFSKRRKTLRNALSGILDEQAIARAGIDPGWRPERLDLAAFIALARRLGEP